MDRETKSQQYEDQALDAIVSILEKGGIAIEKTAIPEEMPFVVHAFPRDEADEAARAANLLGGSAAPDADGVYTGARGSLRFYPDGAFSFTAAEGAYPQEGKSPETAAEDFLARLGIECASPQLSEDGDTVTLSLRYQGAPVYAPRALTVTVQGGFLTAAEGYCLSGAPTAEEGEEPLSVVSILLKFLGYIKENVFVCREIREMTAGYTLAAGQSGAPRLVPTWRISADSGDYALSALTGEIL